MTVDISNVDILGIGILECDIETYVAQFLHFT
jgi:hypothetical protein